MCLLQLAVQCSSFFLSEGTLDNLCTLGHFIVWYDVIYQAVLCLVVCHPFMDCQTDYNGLVV